MLILIFIFMTPKSWFANGELPRRLAHQTATVSTVIIGAEVVDNERDKGQLQQQIRTLSGQPNAQIVGDIRPRKDGAGKTIAYEVDIR